MLRWTVKICQLFASYFDQSIAHPTDDDTGVMTTGVRVHTATLEVSGNAHKDGRLVTKLLTSDTMTEKERTQCFQQLQTLQGRTASLHAELESDGWGRKPNSNINIGILHDYHRGSDLVDFCDNR